MTISTCDLSDKYGDKCRFLTPVFRHFSGRKRFHGLIATLRCPEDNTRLKELASTAGCGRVLVVDSGGSLRYALMGDLVGKLALAHGFLRVCFFAIEHSSRIFAPVGVSTEAGHDHSPERSVPSPSRRAKRARPSS